VRVLIVSAHGEDPSSGGVEKGLMELSPRLTALGVEVAYLQAFPARAPVDEVERTVLHGSDWRDDRARRLKNHLADVLAWPRSGLEEAVARHRPDLVHTNNLPGVSTAVWEACRRLGLPVVHTIHDYYLLCPRTTMMRRDGTTPCRPSPVLCGLRTRRLARWASAVSHVIGVSQHVIDVHAHLFPGAELHVIRNPMIASSLGDLRPPRPRPAVLGYIGSLDRIKGVHLLLEAASRLEALGLTLRIAGEGRLRDEVALAAEQRANVQWDGAVLGERKERFFEACDIGVVPSVWAEPGGPTYTMVEWLSAGRPVFVSRRGGLGEVAGLYPGSIPLEPTVDSIVESIAALLEPARWEETVAAVRPIDAEQKLEDWVERHEALYRSMAQGARSSRSVALPDESAQASPARRSQDSLHQG
jgi:glycosyltransferase involved in cell wall biosynthesis